MINVGKEEEPMWLTDVAQSTDLPANWGSIPSRRCDFFFFPTYSVLPSPGVHLASYPTVTEFFPRNAKNRGFKTTYLMTY